MVRMVWVCIVLQFPSRSAGQSASVVLDSASGRSANLSPEVDITTAIVTAVQALVWPVAALLGILFLRREIRALFERISQIKYKDLEIAPVASIDSWRFSKKKIHDFAVLAFN